MIIVSGIIEFDPASHDAAVELIGPLVEATLAEEGNGTYGFWADPTTPGRFRVYEEWDSDEALAAHSASAHMAAFVGGLGPLGVTSSTFTRHEVTESRSL